jgi:hypothetical protein
MATYYWVGGSGTWDTTSTTNWSSTSGGAGGAGVPNSADTVFFDANSGGGTCTLGENVTCLILTMSNYTGTLDFQSFKITLTGNATQIFAQSLTMGVAGTPVIECSYSGGTGTRTITGTTAGEGSTITIKVIAGTDTFAMGTGRQYKTVDFTGFSGTLTNTTRTIFGDLTVSSGMTLSAGASATTFAATSGTQQITTNGKTLDFPITQNGVGGTVQLQDNLTMGSTRIYTLTNGTLDLSSGNRTLSAGVFSSSNSNARAIAFGTGNITLTNNSASIWIMNVATGFAYTGTAKVNCTYSGSSGTRTINTGSSGGEVESNVISFYITAGSDTFATSNATGYKTLDFTGFSGTLNLGSNSLFGDLVISSGMTISASANTATFASTSGTQQITTAGKTFDFPLTFNGIGGTFVFQDALTQGSTRAFTVSNGAIKLKSGVTSSVGVFSTFGTNQKFLQSTTPGSQATLSQASGTINASYLTIQDINATGGATWNARTDLGSKDITNNTGWNFIFIAIQQILKPIMAKILQPIILN